MVGERWIDLLDPSAEEFREHLPQSIHDRALETPRTRSDVELSFGDAYDKLLRAADRLELSRNLAAGVRDYEQAKISNDQNEVMKRLTAVASILLLPTFIVGL